MVFDTALELSWWERVDVLRRRHKYTMEDVAKAVGVSRMHVYRLASNDDRWDFTEEQRHIIETLVAFPKKDVKGA